MKRIMNNSLVLQGNPAAMVLIIVLLVSVFPAAIFAAKKAPKTKPSSVEPNTVISADAVPAPNMPAPNMPAPTSSKETTGSTDGNRVAVTVNGSQITEAQIEAIIDLRIQQLAGGVSEDLIPRYRQQMRKHVIEQLVIDELLTQEEKKNNIDVNQTELDQSINKQVAEQNLTIDEFKALLRAYGTDFADYERNMRKKLMFEKLMESQIVGNIQEITDDQARAFYDENIQQFREPERIHAKHILIRPADSNDPNEAGLKARAEAEKLLARLKDGADFDDLAKQHSACPSGKSGGDLGVQARGSFVPEFEKAAYALKPGELSDIVRTNFGFHIIKLIEHMDANTINFDAAKNRIVETLSNKQKEQFFMKYISRIKAQADIQYMNEGDKPEIMGEKTAGPDRSSEQDQKTSAETETKKD